MTRRARISALRAIAGSLAGAILAIGGLGAGRAAEQEPARLRVAPEQVEVDLVLIDVLVRGRDGAPARGLTREDFELIIDRLPAPIDTFESYCPEQAAAPAGAPAPAEAAPPQPRHIVLFFDIDHLSRSGREKSLDAAVQFVREGMTPNDRVMLLALKGSPILLEPFSSDRKVLEERLEAVRADEKMVDLSYLEERLNMHDILMRDCASLDGLCRSRQAVAVPFARAEEAKARRSLETLKSLMPALAGIKGRKTIVHFAENLRDEPGMQYLLLARTTPKAEGIDIQLLVKDLHRAANAAGVSLYPVFAAGLGEGSGAGATDASFGGGGQSGDAAARQAAVQAGEDASLALITVLALETGGSALKRSNDLSKIFTTVRDDLACYYVLGYRNTGPGDGARHGIIVKAKRKGLELRHRPYFEDYSDEQKTDSRFESALLAPAFYRELPVALEAYSMVPGPRTTPVLVKAEVPLRDLTLLGGPDGHRTGEVEVRGTVWTGSKESCRFRRQFPVSLDPGEEPGERKVVYEAGCELPPGDHLLTVAVLDAGSRTLGAAETPLPVRPRQPGIAGDVLLWTSSAGDRLVAADAAAIGIRDAGSGHGFVPRAERRFGAREVGLLYAIVCPPEGSKGTVEVERAIYAGDQVVATFPAVTLGAADGAAPGEAPPAPGDCQGIFAPVPPGRLGAGFYEFEIRISGMGAEPIVRRSGFAVDVPPIPSPVR